MLAADPLLTILIQWKKVNIITRAKQEMGEVFGLAGQSNSKTRGC